MGTAMRYSNLFCVLVIFLAGCGSKGDLYLPEAETEEVRPTSIQEETFQPETEQQELRNIEVQPDESEQELQEDEDE
jgi:predicted small lipoprotein YifL